MEIVSNANEAPRRRRQRGGGATMTGLEACYQANSRVRELLTVRTTASAVLSFDSKQHFYEYLRQVSSPFLLNRVSRQKCQKKIEDSF